MNFDVFNGIKFPEKYGGAKRLLDYCKESERNILINPWLSLDAARNALMTLCKGLLKIHGVKQTLREDGQANLVTMIQTCVDNGLFSNGDAAHTVRKNRNNAEYYKKKQDYLPINRTTVSLATESTLALFNIMKEAFDGFETVCFDELKIPFGNYEIDRVVEKSESEILYGQYNYTMMGEIICFGKFFQGELILRLVWPSMKEISWLKVESKEISVEKAIFWKP